GLVDAASASPWESRLRMFSMLEAGLPRPHVNVPVFTTHGSFIAIPDLLDADTGLVTEFDGQEHRQRRQHREDIPERSGSRRSTCWGVGWTASICVVRSP
ncbi:MAG TPA: hypothetical protein VIT42_17200, partial [Microlunatus sp.]